MLPQGSSIAIIQLNGSRDPATSLEFFFFVVSLGSEAWASDDD